MKIRPFDVDRQRKETWEARLELLRAEVATGGSRDGGWLVLRSDTRKQDESAGYVEKAYIPLLVRACFRS